MFMRITPEPACWPHKDMFALRVATVVGRCRILDCQASAIEEEMPEFVFDVAVAHGPAAWIPFLERYIAVRHEIDLVEVRGEQGYRRRAEYYMPPLLKLLLVTGLLRIVYMHTDRSLTTGMVNLVGGVIAAAGCGISLSFNKYASNACPFIAIDSWRPSKWV